ncbi:hypothetical protein MN608_07168 [Microdochium nivale]|nr:hypothetical protein MN608_07168 [Microdochium nivale]
MRSIAPPEPRPSPESRVQPTPLCPPKPPCSPIHHLPAERECVLVFAAAASAESLTAQCFSTPAPKRPFLPPSAFRLGPSRPTAFLPPLPDHHIVKAQVALISVFFSPSRVPQTQTTRRHATLILLSTTKSDRGTARHCPTRPPRIPTSPSTLPQRSSQLRSLLPHYPTPIRRHSHLESLLPTPPPRQYTHPSVLVGTDTKLDGLA